MRKDNTGLARQGEPILAAAEAEHCRRMHAHIELQIGMAGGWLSFERFMDLALYAPGLGYYSAGAHKLGADGDFTTAPEISSLFGGCIARQCVQVLEVLGGGSILEIGAGTGRLAVDVLRRLQELGCLPEQYLILDVSADLRQRQQALIGQELPHLLGRVRWLDTPAAAPFDGVIIANEVLDALPVARFLWRRDQLEELGVVSDSGHFKWAARAAGEPLLAACRSIAARAGGEWEEGYLSETCLRLRDWTAQVTQPLHRGAVLWIDYGLPQAQYYLAERQGGTLLCHFRQRAYEDPLRYPGLQDITAWVDYTALAQSGSAAGFEVAGYTNQAYFLAGCSIEQEMHARAGADENQFARLANQARQLLLPGEMGERFKAMAWTRGMDLELCGFAVRDFLHTL